MPRDYKHTTKKRRASRAGPQRRWPWLAGGLAGGLLIGYGVYFFTTHGLPGNVRTAHQSVPAPTAAVAPTAAAATPAKTAARPADDKDGKDKSRFDFYTLLPEMEVKITDDTFATARGGARKPAQAGPYILQVGSFRSHAEADSLKARLALVGVEASIQAVIISADETWYRVRVGPYKNIKDLQQARTNLQRNNIDFMLLRLET